MGDQNEIINPLDLFNKDRFLIQKVWARKPILRY